MKYKNHKVAEVVCILDLLPNKGYPLTLSLTNIINALKEKRFSYEQNKKLFKIDFEEVGTHTVEVQAGVYWFIKPDDERYRVCVQDWRVSFHVIKTYPGWETFREECLDELLPIFTDVISKNEQIARGVSFLYINKFDLKEGESNSDYLRYIMSPSVFNEEAKEWIQNYQTVFRLKNNTEVLANSRYIIPNEGDPHILLSCLASKTFATEEENQGPPQATEEFNINLFLRAMQTAHDYANKIFELTVSERTLEIIT